MHEDMLNLHSIKIVFSLFYFISLLYYSSLYCINIFYLHFFLYFIVNVVGTYNHMMNEIIAYEILQYFYFINLLYIILLFYCLFLFYEFFFLLIYVFI